MTDQQTNGAATRVGGKMQSALGGLLGDNKTRVEGAVNQAKGSALEVYGQAMDRLDRLVDRAPVAYQDRARSALDVARRKPILTTALVAGLGYILARSASRRR